jgi:glycine/D-amino acid oxidase-like deaminating enzyme/dihydrodipicolinate reductase
MTKTRPFRLAIIGAGGAIGLPASYLASLRNLHLVMIDGGGSALDNSTHTVHSSIVRPNRAIWPFSKAIESCWNNGPFDIRFSPGMIPFGLHSLLQSYCVSDSRVDAMWKAFRTLGLESREIYLDFEKTLGPFTLGNTGRGHLSSPLLANDSEVVLRLRQKLAGFGVESKVLTNHTEIQNYVGGLRVRRPELVVSYPEDFVLDLHRYKSRLLKGIRENGGTYLHDTVVSIEQNSTGNVTLLITKNGQRIATDAVLYAGGWTAATFMKNWLGVNLSAHLNVATGVRFALAGHLVHRSIVCGSMFLAPGHDSSGNPITDVGQMFLVNIQDPYPSKKHHLQALKRFHTYFDYIGDISQTWNCIGRPITTTGLPFIERVALNMVIALGPGMFGVTTGPGIAKRGLDLLLDNKCHPDHDVFKRQSGREIISSFLKGTFQRGNASDKHDSQPASNTIRLIQIGKRGAMTEVLQAHLNQAHNFAVYTAREIDAVIRDVGAHPRCVLLIASHGMQAKLPPHYDKDYVTANDAVEKVLREAPCENLSGIVVISGGIPQPVFQKLIKIAIQKRVRFLNLPGLSTSLEVFLNALRNLLPNFERPTEITIEDTFHKGKKEIPSVSAHQLLSDVAQRFGARQLLILVQDESVRSELTVQYPDATIRVANTAAEIHRVSYQFPNLIKVVIRSYRPDVQYIFHHRLSIQEKNFTVTLEHKVTDRAQLVPPVQRVIRAIPSLPPGFIGARMSSVLPTIKFEPKWSLLRGLSSVIVSLQRASALCSIQIRDGEPDESIREVLMGSGGRLMSFEHDPSLSSSMRINALIDGQPFTISLSTAAT